MKHNVDFRMAVRFLQDLKESHCSFTRTRRRSQSLLVPHAAPPLLREPPHFTPDLATLACFIKNMFPCLCRKITK